MVLQIKQAICEYDLTILKTARLYYGMYVSGKQWTDVDCSDLEQAGRMAVFNIASKRPEKLGVKAYVNAAIRYSMFGEMTRMKHKVEHVYLAYNEDMPVPIVDILPTKESIPERLTAIDSLLYHIREAFSQREADALDALVQRCDDVYDLNLSSSLSLDTKQRVKVVTAMDLDDEEMMIYAQVLTGARKKFPEGYFRRGEASKKTLQRYVRVVLNAKRISIKRFAVQDNKERILRLFRLYNFMNTTYNCDTFSLLHDIKPSIKREDIKYTKKWDGRISAEEMSRIICGFIVGLGRTPKEISTLDFVNSSFSGMFDKVFNNSNHFAIEFAVPGTYPEYADKAQEIREKYTQRKE